MLQVDRLYEAVAEKSPVCVGLDTDFSYIPAECVDKTLSKGENIFRFNRDIIEATRSVAGCFKVHGVGLHLDDAQACAGTAGQAGDGKRGGKRERKQFFHIKYPLSVFIYGRRSCHIHP